MPLLIILMTILGLLYFDEKQKNEKKMSNELVKHEGVHAPSTFTEDQIETIKRMYCKGATDDEFKVFLFTCERTGLCPFSKQVFAIKRGAAMTIQTSIDGYRLVAERTGRYCPGQKPTYEYDKNGKLLSATAYVKKLTKDGTWHVVEAEAAFSEYMQAYNGKPSGLWEKMPRVMLAKCAEALAIRKCFPAELSGVYTREEMEQAESIDVTPALQEAPPIEFCEGNEIEELKALISSCEPDKQEAFTKFLESKLRNGKLEKKCFGPIRDRLIAKRDEYQDKLLNSIPLQKEEVHDGE